MRAQSPLNAPLASQIIITTDKERAVNERALAVEFDVPMRVSVSRALNPADYDDLDAWFEAILALWDSTWKDAYETPVESCSLVEKVPLKGARATALPLVTHRAWLFRIIFIVAIVMLKIVMF